MASEWVDAAFKLPVNGGDRWRLSRRLAGGFRFCLLPRCTDPRLSIGEQKILVPFFAVFSFVETRIPVVCDFVNNFAKGLSRWAERCFAALSMTGLRSA
jgi:hypothetical protein